MAGRVAGARAALVALCALALASLATAQRQTGSTAHSVAVLSARTGSCADFLLACAGAAGVVQLRLVANATGVFPAGSVTQLSTAPALGVARHLNISTVVRSERVVRERSRRIMGGVHCSAPRRACKRLPGTRAEPAPLSAHPRHQ
jgi:hypothetical protein